MIKKLIHIMLFSAGILFLANCQPAGRLTSTHSSAEYWVTKADASKLLEKQKSLSVSEKEANRPSTIDLDTKQSYQTIDGFGYTLTGGSAMLINGMKEDVKNKLLSELFGNGAQEIGVSYLRISVGASDLDAEVFSYNDLPPGETDPEQKNFSIKADKKNLIPTLKKILSINPKIKILASPWSPPAWMKTNNSTIGGSLKPEYYNSYAQYFIKYIRAMQAEGITIDAITIQNEPLHPGNNPSMYMTAEQQRDFIKNSLGPAFKSNNIKTKIIIYDHNLDRPDYPITILKDPEARKYVDGSAFHLYAGKPEAMSQVHDAHPDKKLYFTEQWTGAKSSFEEDLQWHIKNVIIGTMNNWSKNALEWNLANDPKFEPHTPGGCTECKGAITIDGSNFTRNVSYYIIAHASKFVPPGSVRVRSTPLDDISHVAFLRPDKKIAVILLNDNSTHKEISISNKNKVITVPIEAHSAATVVWQ